ncbi:MAG: hypothetical protein LW847_15390, partial [Burkholderiales bacterium]|jgi:hypothetical protein|nr:hypothetical protein [Burkholderiales bacterium]
VVLAGSYGGSIAAAAVAGLGNSVFHPVDFTLLNHRVSTPRLGHAFSCTGCRATSAGPPRRSS